MMPFEETDFLIVGAGIVGLAIARELRERYPEAVQPLLRAMPLTALVDALRGVMLEGESLAACWPEVATLVIGRAHV